MQVLTDINMNNNEVLQVIIHKVSSDPTVSAKNSGMIIFNTTDKKLKYYNGSECQCYAVSRCGFAHDSVEIHDFLAADSCGCSCE